MMHRSRESRLRRKMTRYPVLNALSDSGKSTPPPSPPTTVRLASLILDGESTFLAYLRSLRYEELSTSQSTSGPDSATVLVQDVLDLVNCGGMFVPGIRKLMVTSNTTRNPETDCFLFLYLVVLAKEPQKFVLPSGAAPIGDESICDKFFCCIFLLKYGTFDEEAWNRLPDTDDLPDIGSQPWILAPLIVKECESASTQWAAVTDGVTTALIEVYSPERTGGEAMLGVTVEREPFQLCLARLVMVEADKCGILDHSSSYYWSPPSYSGALKSPQSPIAIEEEKINLKGFYLPNFDVFSIQRDEQYWKHFLAAQESAETAALDNPLLPGNPIRSSGVLTSGNFLLLPESPVPFPAVPIETRYRLWCDREELRRPRDAVASALIALEGNRNFSFQISDTFRTGKASYSQTICGFVELPAEDGSVLRSGKLCLKLYDERLFKVPTYEASEKDTWLWFPQDTQPWDRVIDWTTAEDMARRECAAYDRLKDYQGFVVPHCYGLFEFQLPDGYCCIGLLMELVDGKHLHEFRSDELSELEKGELVTDLRHAVRVLRYAQVHQADWNSGNIIVSRLSKSVSGPEGSSPENEPDGVLHDDKESSSGDNTMVRGHFRIVLIDFAFAFQHLLVSPTPLVSDLTDFRHMLYELGIFSRDVIRGLWFDREGDENEW